MTTGHFNLDDVRSLAADVLAPGHFFTAPDLGLEWAHQDREETAWEIFHGRLLDPAHTRQHAVFETWNVFQKTPNGRAAEPLLSLKLDQTAGMLFVVRGLECWVWEGYDSGGGVFLSRESRKWVRELVAVLRLAELTTLEELRREMGGAVFRAVVGTSRLPLTSVEAPLPAFSFGRLFYTNRAAGNERTLPRRTWRELAQELNETRPEMPASLRPHLLETLLHAVPFEEMPSAAALIGRDTRDLASLLREMFNGISLSPWTDWTAKLLSFLRAANLGVALSSDEIVDFLGHVLNQLCRHLTAYDLVTFHHRGANYPDALLLDAVLKEYVGLAERFPQCFLDPEDDDGDGRKGHRLRRRGLRMAWLLRRHYEGHPVPDAPTSPGENNRVLPPSHPRIPEEQVLQTNRRTRRLYDSDPLTNHLGANAADILRQSIEDLRYPDELRELGVGLFLDRPLSAAKKPGEPDATPLAASIAFSRAIAVQRANALLREEMPAPLQALLHECLHTLQEKPPRGLLLDQIGGASRPGAVTLADARLASPDFEFLWTTLAPLTGLQRLFDFTPMVEQFGAPFGVSPGRMLLVRSPSGRGINVHDMQYRLRMTFEPDESRGWTQRNGVELPVNGLLVTRVWMEEVQGLREHDLRTAPLRLRLLL